jgi:hypothetical protein
MNNPTQDLALRPVRGRPELVRLLQLWLLFVLICGLLGCNVGPRYARPNLNKLRMAVLGKLRSPKMTLFAGNGGRYMKSLS